MRERGDGPFSLFHQPSREPAERRCRETGRGLPVRDPLSFHFGPFWTIEG
jgi:hypothetical protein